MSKDLNKADIYTKEEDIEEVLECLDNVKRTHSADFSTEYYGVVTYTQIVCASAICAPPTTAQHLPQAQRMAYTAPRRHALPVLSARPVLSVGV